MRKIRMFARFKIGEGFNNEKLKYCKLSRVKNYKSWHQESNFLAHFGSVRLCQNALVHAAPKTYKP